MHCDFQRSLQMDLLLVLAAIAVQTEPLIAIVMRFEK
jgi:hypothetical protein